MKKIMAGLTAIAVALMMSACTTITPISATSNAFGSKVGEASMTLLLGTPLTMESDISIKKAAKNGNITRISTVDQKVYQLGALYQVITTVVTGE